MQGMRYKQIFFLGLVLISILCVIGSRWVRIWRLPDGRWSIVRCDRSDMFVVTCLRGVDEVVMIERKDALGETTRSLFQGGTFEYYREVERVDGTIVSSYRQLA